MSIYVLYVRMYIKIIIFINYLSILLIFLYLRVVFVNYLYQYNIKN